jgi:Papain family cysteine protease
MTVTFDAVATVIRNQNAPWRTLRPRGTVPVHSLGLLPDNEARNRLQALKAQAELPVEIALARARTPTAMRVAGAPVPVRVDWRDYNEIRAITPVRNQGSCGSCVAFAATAMLESMVIIEYGSGPEVSPFLNLSEADLFFCGGGDCANGWWPDDAVGRIVRQGVPVENCFPYPAPARQVPCAPCDARGLQIARAGQSIHYFNAQSRKRYLAEVGPRRI